MDYDGLLREIKDNDRFSGDPARNYCMGRGVSVGINHHWTTAMALDIAERAYSLGRYDHQAIPGIVSFNEVWPPIPTSLDDWQAIGDGSLTSGVYRMSKTPDGVSVYAIVKDNPFCIIEGKQDFQDALESASHALSVHNRQVLAAAVK